MEGGTSESASLLPLIDVNATLKIVVVKIE